MSLGVCCFLFGCVPNQAAMVRAFFGAESVFELTTVLLAACLIQFVYADADLVFEFDVLRLRRKAELGCGFPQSNIDQTHSEHPNILSSPSFNQYCFEEKALHE
jgi:hypothetical protein